MLRRVPIGLGLLLLAGSILFLAWGYWPAHRELRVRPVSFPSDLVLPEEYRLTLLYPPRMRVGEAAVVKLTFGPAIPGNSSPTAGVACPSKAIKVHQSTFEQIMAQVEALDWSGMPLPTSLAAAEVPV